MMFSAGMGIGLVFGGAAEPLSHYAILTPNAPVQSKEAPADAFRFTFFHWGIHAWAVYALIGLALAYFGFRKTGKIPIVRNFKAIARQIYRRHYRQKIIDIITIVATVSKYNTSVLVHHK